MNNREFLQLAKTYDPAKHNVVNWYMSEKLDGMRAIWDGGISLGKYADEVPYANTQKDKDRVVATGLWSRYGKVIYAPDWFLQGMPDYPLDGELYLGPGQFQETMSIVRCHEPDLRWHNIKFKVFALPSYEMLLKEGRINNPQWKEHRIPSGLVTSKLQSRARMQRFKDLCTLEFQWPKHVRWHGQIKIQSLEHMRCSLDTVCVAGGEGLILRHPNSVWVPKRTDMLLKVKPDLDSEGTVIGYVWGEGKLEGMIGSLIVKWRDKTFNLSGFTDAERQIEGTGEPGTLIRGVESERFPIGSAVTFKYRELSDSGIPKEARYFRVAT